MNPNPHVACDLHSLECRNSVPPAKEEKPLDSKAILNIITRNSQGPWTGKENHGLIKVVPENLTSIESNFPQGN
jgi:hypothetical protein